MSPIESRTSGQTVFGRHACKPFRDMQSAFYSLWCKQFGDQPVELFETEWKNHAGAVKRLCEWVKAPELEQIVSTALMQSEEEASVAILESSG